MKLAILSQYYPPVENACANRVVAMARAFHTAGHDVTVVTGMPNYPTGVKPAGYRWKALLRERIDEVGVIRTYEYAAENAGMLRRLLNYGSFTLSSLAAVPLLGKLDCLIVSSPPLFATISARWIKAVRARHLICDVRDVWPRSLYEIGHASPGSLSIRLMARWERAVYKHSSALVATTRRTQAYLEEYCRREFSVEKPVFFTPNGISTDFQLQPAAIEIPPDRFVLLYSGNFSAAQDLMQFFEFAKRLRDEPNELSRVHFLFVGDGELRSEMEQHVARHELKNVQLAPWLPREQALDLIRRCDACLVSLKDVPLFQEVLPSKTFEYMYFEKPIFCNTDGELRHLLEAADCGYFFRPHDYESFKSATHSALANPQERTQKGRQGKQHVVAHYQREIIMKQMVRDVEAAS